MERMTSLCVLGDQVIAFPQDDYTYNIALDEGLATLEAHTIYTPIETGLDIVYPMMHGRASIRHATPAMWTKRLLKLALLRNTAMQNRVLHVGQRENVTTLVRQGRAREGPLRQPVCVDCERANTTSHRYLDQRRRRLCR